MKHSVTELNVSWHCLVCNSPNYSATVHDLFSSEVTFCSSSVGPVPDSVVSSPDPSRHTLKPVHSATPTRKQPSQQKMKVPLRVLNVNFQSIKMKQRRLFNILESVKPDVVIGTETWLDHTIKDSKIFPKGSAAQKGQKYRK